MIGAMDASKPTGGSGGCLCGGVRYDVSGLLREVVLCHCSRCRRTHGHVAAYTECATGDLTLVQDTSLRWYDADNRQRGFCARCGGSVFWRADEDPETISIAAGTLDKPTGLRTLAEIYVESRGDYYELTGEAERHARGRGAGGDTG
jgi:hypothetical protein